MKCRIEPAVVLIVVAMAAARLPAQGGWQVNSAAASLDVNGVQSNGESPAITFLCAGATNILTASSSLPPLPIWDMAITVGPLVPNGLVVPGGDIFNINLADPTLFFLLSGTATPALNPFPGGSLSILLPASSPIQASAQSIFIDPTSVAGFKLSQGVTIIVDPVSGLLTFPSQDDDTITLIVAGASACVPMGTLPFYNTYYNQVHVSTNGRICFGNPPGSSSAFATSSLDGQPPFVGFWTDLDPRALGATLQASSIPGPALQVRWTNVPYFGATTPLITFSISVDSNGVITVGGLLSIPVNPAGGNKSGGIGDAQFLGIHPGGGSIPFTNLPFTLTGSGSPGTVPAGAARFEFWDGNGGASLPSLGQRRLDTIGNGVNQITFTPDGFDGYVFTCL